jgi:Rod binding domain-containing protein
MFTGMLDAEMAKAISASGGIGLSAMVRKQLETVPETGNAKPTK